MNIYKKANKTAKYYYEFFLEHTQARYAKEALIMLVVTGLLFGGYAIFNVYKKRQDVQAFAGLVEVSRAYEKALTSAQNPSESLDAEQVKNNWEDVQLLLEALSSAHKRSSLSPLFTLYQADLALEKDGDYEKACTLMKQGISQLSKKSIYYDMFNLKLIKMLLDSPQEKEAMNAVADLKLIASNSDNYYYQDALHTLAMYQSANNDMPAAIQAWIKLVHSQQEKSLIVSPFVTQAQEKLKSLNISLETGN